MGGGISTSDITLIYGEAGTGKSSLAIQCAVNAGRLGCKTIFIDSEDTFSTKRFSQIAYSDFDEVAPTIILVKPATFQEQARVIDRLEKYLTSNVRLLILDTITSLYRIEIGDKKEETFVLNRELGRQLACLTQIVKTKRVAVLITSQVHSKFIKGSVKIEPVATRVLWFWSDTVLNLKPTNQRNAVKAVLEKHSERKFPANCYLYIEEVGICDYVR